MADWYYIGHFGQLGPLTKDQVDDLIDGGVIESDTYVWRTGMGDWVPADQAPDLSSLFKTMAAQKPPPPPPPGTRKAAPPPFSFSTPDPEFTKDLYPNPYSMYQPAYMSVQSDRSRVLAGILQLLIPGTGRIYLGYAAHGVLQLILTPCLGLGWFWSVIDGILILGGGLRLDGYGRKLPD